MDTQKQIEDNDLPSSGSAEPSKPTIVLVHGALEDSSLWTHGVIQGLKRDGLMNVTQRPMHVAALNEPLTLVDVSFC